MSTSTHARELLEQGFTVLERTHGDEDLDALRAGTERLYRAQGSPRPYADPIVQLTPELLVNPTGFVITKLLALAPELAPRLLSHALVDTARAVLGPDMFLELTGAVITDATRPFFSWHNHIGGIDVEDYRARRVFPRFEQSERLIAVLYLEDVDEAGGELLALPRRITEPTEPLGHHRATHWDGEVVLRFPRGSTLVFEQCTWHAVRPVLREGLRTFVGCYLTSTRAPATQATDDSLAGFRGGGELLESVLPRGRSTSQPR